MKIEELALPANTAVVERGSDKHRRIVALREAIVDAANEACRRDKQTTANEVMAAFMVTIASMAVDLGVGPERAAEVLRANCEAVAQKSLSKEVG